MPESESSNTRRPYDVQAANVASQTPSWRSQDKVAEYGDGFASLLEYWHILRRRKWTILLVTAFSLAAGVGLTAVHRPMYQAQASIEIQSLNQRFLNMGDMNPTAPESNGSTPDNEIQTQLRILQSRSLLERVIARAGFEKRLIDLDKPGPFSRWLRSQGLLAPWKPPSRDDLVSAAAANLKLRAQASTRVVDIQFDAPNSQLATEFANALAAEYAQQHIESRWQAARDTSDWLSAHLSELKAKLEHSEGQLQAYARTAGLLFTGENDNIADDKLRQLQQDVEKARAERMTRQSTYELAAKASPDTLPDVIEDATLRDYQIKAADLHRQFAELMSSLTPANPSVKKVQAQIAFLETLLQKRRNDLVQRVRNDYQAARRREELLTADYNAHSALTAQQAVKVAHYNILKHEVDTNRQLYESLLQRGKEAAVASALRANNVRVIDTAKPPKRPYKPSLPINAGISLFSGLSLGIIASLARENAKKTIQQPGDAFEYLSVPEIGLIPSQDVRSLLTAPDVNSSPSPVSGTASLAYRDKLSEQRYAAARGTVLADAFRAILLAIVYGGNKGARPKVVVVASAHPQDGKTSVIVNTGIALARISQRVLLVDGDLRKPRLHKLFSIENAAGLTEYLGDDSAAPTVQPTDTPGLYVMPAGKCSDAHVLYSSKLGTLLGQLRSEFDVILIDTPPMFHISDARMFGLHADAVVLVLRSGQTTPEAARKIADQLAHDGTPILGAVLNHWNPNQGSYPNY